MSCHLPYCPFLFWLSKFLPVIASVWHLVQPPSLGSSNQSSTTHEHAVGEISLLGFLSFFFFLSKRCRNIVFFVYLVYFFTQTFYLVSLYPLSSNRKGLFPVQIVIDRFQKITHTVQLQEKEILWVRKTMCRSLSLTSMIE